MECQACALCRKHSSSICRARHSGPNSGCSLVACRGPPSLGNTRPWPDDASTMPSRALCGCYHNAQLLGVWATTCKHVHAYWTLSRNCFDSTLYSRVRIIRPLEMKAIRRMHAYLRGCMGAGWAGSACSAEPSSCACNWSAHHCTLPWASQAGPAMQGLPYPPYR